MLESIISGIGFGIVLSFLAGPVFFALIKTSIEKGFYAGISLALGVLVCDIIYVSLTVYGSSFLRLENAYRLQIGIVGSVILLLIGVYYLFKDVKINYQSSTSKRHNTGYFLKGFFMCIFNPAVLIYWLSVTSSRISIAGQFKPADIIPFYGSILLTQLALDAVKVYYANKLRYRIKEQTMKRLNQIAGTLIIIFAFRIIFNLLIGHPLI